MISLRVLWNTLGTLRSDNGDGNGNVRSLGRAGPRRVGVPAKIEITNFTSENVDDGHWCLSCLSQRKFFRKPCQSSMTLFSWFMLPVWLTLKNSCYSTIYTSLKIRIYRTLTTSASISTRWPMMNVKLCLPNEGNIQLRLEGRFQMKTVMNY